MNEMVKPYQESYRAENLDHDAVNPQ